MSLYDDIRSALDAAVRETGGSLGKSTAEVASYLRERTLKLVGAADHPGTGIALVAERQNVRMFAGVAAVGEAEKLDARLVGIIDAGLRIGLGRLTGALA